MTPAQTATQLFWGEPLGFCVGFQPDVDNGDGEVTIERTVPLLADDGCPSDEAALYDSGDDLIVRRETKPPTPVQHPTQGELWPGPDLLLFRTQAELDSWLSDIFGSPSLKPE